MQKFPVLEAQMLLSGSGRKALSDTLGIHYNTLCRKMRGEIPFTLDEAMAIKRILKTELSLEDLFEVRDRNPESN